MGLAHCHGYLVAASDAPVGVVETPVFAAAASDPDYLIVRTSRQIAGTFRAVPAALVSHVDLEQRLITLAARPDDVAALPERLPLERR